MIGALPNLAPRFERSEPTTLNTQLSTLNVPYWFLFRCARSSGPSK